jgi:hypothetical protein
VLMIGSPKRVGAAKFERTIGVPRAAQVSDVGHMQVCGSLV